MVRTTNTSQLVTWWHAEAEVNTSKNNPVQVDNVRQSGLYSVQVALGGSDKAFYDSFVYHVVPANGMDDQRCNSLDLDQDQSWSSFLYSEDVVVKVTRSNKTSGSVVIRPTNLGFDLDDDGESVFITVPYSDKGYRFSVEFEDNLMVVTPSNAREPRNALLIFASPTEDASVVPADGQSVTHPAPGRVRGLDTTEASTVHFGPGVYYFGGEDHMKLSPSVTWVYFAPGAYVKGAVEFTSKGPEVKATGHGVLSGEQYVWYADPAHGYRHPGDANNNGLRMWSGNNGDNPQTFVLNGVTICAPPFNSMDWKGWKDSVAKVTCRVRDYKQVGSFYFETDGIQVYPGSSLEDVFYHANDDTIKMYHSNVSICNLVVWKLNVAPIVQFGWEPRNTENVTIDGVDVIHQAYNNEGSNPGLFGSNNNYRDVKNGLPYVWENDEKVWKKHTADVKQLTRNITLSNFRSEGPSACLFRICPLQNIDNVTIRNVWIESWEPDTLDTTNSRLLDFYDRDTGEQVNITNFTIKGLVVGDVPVTAENADTVGKIKEVHSSYKSQLKIL
ncbi:Isopullulanase [Escovopsis weberi]|uniref:Isopullulanase n=1 Tax=Escovopsis weberi TaxID=150374 RepID=A0A0M8N300_ESCWE|nr:Isopullulanase [Escovopsis weberi]